MHPLNRKDFFTGLLFSVLGAAYLASAFFIGTYKGYGSQNISSSFMPKTLGSLLIGLSLLLIWQSLRTPSTENTQDGLIFKSGELKPFLLVFAVLIAYIALIVPLGFVITSCVFLFVAIKILAPGKKSSVALTLGISLVVPIAVYALFVYALDMALPEGILG